jgi:GMP synthase (glutamine-hydrolysing)
MPPAFFLSRVKGTSDPETKHKVIGNTFIEVFQNKAKEIAAIAAGSPQAGDIELLLQGTLYLDTLRRGKISVTVYEGCGPL